MLNAFLSGAHLIWIGKRDVYYSAAPSVVATDVQHRLHNETGPAFVWLADVQLHFWHGTLIPPEWIVDRASLTPQTALRQTNAELRRAACEILGWETVLAGLNPKVIDTDADPEIGQLVEIDLGEMGRRRLLRVRCGTGRQFALPVPQSMTTALEANAWMYFIPPDLMKLKEHRT